MFILVYRIMVLLNLVCCIIFVGLLVINVLADLCETASVSTTVTTHDKLAPVFISSPDTQCGTSSPLHETKHGGQQAAHSAQDRNKTPDSRRKTVLQVKGNGKPLKEKCGLGEIADSRQ